MSLHVCSYCGLLGPLQAFEDECSPGWPTHHPVTVKAVALPDDDLRLRLADLAQEAA